MSAALRGRIAAVAGFLCIAVPLAFGQSPGNIAATVTLLRPQNITQQQLDKQVSVFEAGAQRAATAQERKDLLSQLIARTLLAQATERDKITVTDAEVSARLQVYRKSIGQGLNLGREVSDEELRKIVATRGYAWDDFLADVRMEALGIAYVKVRKQAELEKIAAPTNAEVEAYYNDHKKDFVSDDMVQVRHIFIDTRSLTAKEDRDKAAARAADILRELKAGGSFEELALKYSEDPTSKYRGGVLGILDRLDAQSQNLFGKPFFDAVFKLKKGETSGVLQSNVGLHIVQVINRYDAALVGLDDKIPPAYQVTARELIRQNLIAQGQNEAFAKAQDEVLKDLTAQAKITRY